MTIPLIVLVPLTLMILAGVACFAVVLWVLFNAQRSLREGVGRK